MKGPLEGGFLIGPIWTPKGTPIWALLRYLFMELIMKTMVDGILLVTLLS